MRSGAGCRSTHGLMLCTGLDSGSDHGSSPRTSARLALVVLRHHPACGVRRSGHCTVTAARSTLAGDCVLVGRDGAVHRASARASRDGDPVRSCGSLWNPEHDGHAGGRGRRAQSDRIAADLVAVLCICSVKRPRTPPGSTYAGTAAEFPAALGKYSQLVAAARAPPDATTRSG
jgi:hypothetical protein